MIFKLILFSTLFFISCANNDAPGYSSKDLRRALSIPEYKRPLESKIDRRWIERDVVFENVSFNGRIGERINGLVSYSLLAEVQSAPALMLMSGSMQNKEDFYNNLNLLRDWADEGFFLISIDRPSVFGPNAPDPNDILRGWGRPVYDLIRTLDYINERSQARSENIGILGISLGSMEALWLAALDDRIDAVVSISGHLVWPYVFQSGNWQRIFSGLSFSRNLVKNGVTNEEAMKLFYEKYHEIEIVDASNVIEMRKPFHLYVMAGKGDPFNSEKSAKVLYNSALRSFDNTPYCIDSKIYDGAGHNVVKEMQQDALKWFKEIFFYHN